MATSSSLSSREGPPPERPPPPVQPGISTRGAHHTERPKGLRPPRRDQRNWSRAPYTRRNDRRRWYGERGESRRYDERDRRFGSLYDLYSEPSSRDNPRGRARIEHGSSSSSLASQAPSHHGEPNFSRRHTDPNVGSYRPQLSIPSGPSGNNHQIRPNYDASTNEERHEERRRTSSSVPLETQEAPGLGKPLTIEEKMEVDEPVREANVPNDYSDELRERPSQENHDSGSRKAAVKFADDADRSESIISPRLSDPNTSVLNKSDRGSEGGPRPEGPELSASGQVEEIEVSREDVHDPEDISHDKHDSIHPISATSDDQWGHNDAQKRLDETAPNPTTPVSLSPHNDIGSQNVTDDKLQGLLPQERSAKIHVANRLKYLRETVKVHKPSSPCQEWSCDPVEETIANAVKSRIGSLKQVISGRKLEFDELRSSWEKLCVDLDNDKRNIELDPFGSSHSNRRSRGTLKDGARTEQEFQEILANLELQTMRDPLVRARLTSAAIPSMIQDSVYRQERFVDTNNFVEKVPVERVLKDGIDDFSPQEHELFCQAYIAQPKQFGAIAEHIPGRNFNDCVMHYYRTKKRVDYKHLALKKKRRQRKKEKHATSPTSPATPVSPVTPIAPDSHEQEDKPSVSETKDSATALGISSSAQGIPSPVKPLSQTRRESYLPKPVTPIAASESGVENPTSEGPPTESPKDTKSVAHRRQRKSQKKREPEIHTLPENQPQADSHTGKMDTLATLALLDSTALSSSEQRQLDTLVGLYGSRFDEIARRMNKPESSVRTFVEQNPDSYREAIIAADTVNRRTGVLPLFVPKKSPSLPPLPPMVTVQGNGPSIGFFSPRKRQVPMIKQHQNRSSSDPLASSQVNSGSKEIPGSAQPRTTSEFFENRVTDEQHYGKPHSSSGPHASLPSLSQIPHTRGLLERDLYDISEFHIDRYRESNERG